MRLSKKDRERILRQSCGVINEDDAIDPRHYFYNKRKSRSKFRKVYQLCRQVADTLQLVLSDGDSLLAGLNVIDVLPAPDSRRLLIVVGLSASEVDSASHIEVLMERLSSHTPRLRAEIAQSIRRRKTPQLVFELTTK